MRRALGIAVVFVGVLLVGSAVAASGGSADLTVEDSIEIPEQTVENGGSEYTFDRVAIRSPGDDIVVDVTLPDGVSAANVELRNADEEVEDRTRVTESETVTFSGEDTEQYPPGTYMMILEFDGSYEAVHPVIISGYDMSLSYPGEVEPDGSLTVTTNVEAATLDDPPNGVDIVFHGNGEVIDVSADRVDDWTYETTLDLDGVAEGQYTLYAIATGDDEVEGYSVSLGSTTGDTVTVSADSDGGGDQTPPDDGSEEDQTDDETNDGGEETDDGSGGESDDTDGEEETDETNDGGDTDDGEETNGGEVTDGDGETDSSNETDDGEETDGEDSVIDPNDGVEPDQPDDEQSLTLLVPISSLLLVTLLGRRSHN